MFMKIDVFHSVTSFQIHTEQQTILTSCYWVCLSHTGILYSNLPENRGDVIWMPMGTMYDYLRNARCAVLQFCLFCT